MFVATRLDACFQHKAAFALNNMAISMIEKSCYTQAFETLKQAATVARSASLVDDQGRNGAQQSLECLKLASSRLLRPELSPLFVPTSVLMQDVGLNPSDFLPQNRDTGYSLIRMETNGIEFNDDDWALAVATILHNFAVAHLCRTRSSEENTFDVKLRNAAVKMLGMAGSLLSTIFKDCADPFILPHVIVTMTTVVKTLIHVLESCGQVEEARSYHLTLLQLSKVAGSLDGANVVQRACRAAAAA